MKKKTTQIFSKIKPINGLNINTANIGIKSKTKDDIALITFDELANTATVLTKSKTCAPNISWLKKIRKHGKAKVLFVNSGNANTYTGKTGHENVLRIVKELATLNKCKRENILVSSTGVIGEQLPIEKITNSLPIILKKKQKNNQNWKRFAKAITTTDTFLKGCYKKIILKKREYHIIGVSKGSGMIAPNMATMLAFIFTDLKVSAFQLRKILNAAVQKSFNNITVDGDTSTNDMVSIFSVNNKNLPSVPLTSKDIKKFQKELETISIELAKKIVMDGEGAKKFIEIQVNSAKNDKQAKNIAMKIANSLLVKTAIAGEDANWGRIIMAIGNSSASINQKKISVSVGKHSIIKKGEINKNYNEEKLSKYLKGYQIIIKIELYMGNGSGTMWTCDLTKRYIEINADYRS